MSKYELAENVVKRDICLNRVCCLHCKLIHEAGAGVCKTKQHKQVVCDM